MLQFMTPRFVARMPALFRGVAALAAILALLLPAATTAHEGHDHGPPLPPLPSTVKPRLVLETDIYQLVAIVNGKQLTIFLDRYGTNEPITDARIGILSGATTTDATPRKDGTYAAEIAGIDSPGRHEIVFNVSHKEGDDLLAGALEIAPSAPSVPAAQSAPGHDRNRPALIAGLALLIGLGIGLAARTRAKLVISACIALGALALATTVWAHDGHGLSPVPDGTSLSGDIPRRLPDGSVFMPKPSQRLLTLRSQIAIEGETKRAVSLVGRVIADPNKSGVVQSINGGRVSAPEGGLPRLGQAVKRGDVLVTILPALPLADQSTLAEKQRELEGAVLLARQRLQRLTRLGGNVTPRSNIEDTELEISNLEQRLASLRNAKLQPEVLAAPIDGIVSMSRVVAGQVVGAQDILFQVVDPESLWVEALLFDQLDSGAIVEATAVASNGVSMPLAYRGRGRALQAQAIHVQFAIEAPRAGIAIGQPVIVIARKAEPVRGMLLPRDALVRGPGGETMVWQHLDPERFVPRQVRTEPFDGEHVLITGGIAPKDRIVVHAAELLSQVR